MSQPKISSSQLDTGSGTDQVLTLDTFNEVGSGRSIRSWSGTIAPLNGTTTIPFDNTPPLISEGTQIGSVVVTPSRNTSKIGIDFSVTLDSTTSSDNIIVAVFRDSTCIASAVVEVDTAGFPQTLALTFVDSPATTSATTYSGRVGLGVGPGPTWYVNSVSTGNNLGGTLNTSFVLTELA